MGNGPNLAKTLWNKNSIKLPAPIWLVWPTHNMQILLRDENIGPLVLQVKIPWMHFFLWKCNLIPCHYLCLCYTVFTHCLVRDNLLIRKCCTRNPVSYVPMLATCAHFLSLGYAQPITDQVTEVTCPVIGRYQAELTLSKRQKTGLPSDWLQSIIGVLWLPPVELFVFQIILK